MRYLRDHPVIKSTSLTLYGRSLGGAVATYVATLPESQSFVKGIILENTFLSIRKLIPHVVPIFRPFTGLVDQLWPSEETILNIPADIPMLFLAGAKDEMIPPKQFRALYERAVATTKIFRILPHGTHNDTAIQEDYWDYVYQFMLTLVEPIQGEAKEELNDDDIEVLLQMAQAEHDEQVLNDEKEIDTK